MNTLKQFYHNTINFSRRLNLTFLAFILTGILLSGNTEAAQNEKLVVLPFEIVDNTPMPGGQERNQKMLEKITQYIADNIDKERFFEVVPQSKVNETVRDAKLGTDIRNCNLCEFDLAKSVAGEKVMIGWIYKMSILVLTMHIEIKDVATQQTFISKAYDFRGDNEKAWLRAADYMLRDLGEMLGR
ncbi:MAG: DUF2380 domain-containing protein [Candidatus Thiodiazotropha sp. L084R]